MYTGEELTLDLSPTERNLSTTQEIQLLEDLQVSEMSLLLVRCLVHRADLIQQGQREQHQYIDH